MEKRKENQRLAPSLAKMPTSKLLSHCNQGTQNNGDWFKKSLRELKDLRAHLHHAADHCEAAFLNAKKKKTVMEQTMSYVSQAIVTVIDHLGSVSANLEQRLQENTDISDTEQRIVCLKQRLLTCQHYAASLDISEFRRNTKFPRHYQRYTSPLSPSSQKANNLNEASHKQDIVVKTAVRALTNCDSDAKLETPDAALKSGTRLVLAVPVISRPQMLSKPLNPLFGTPEMEAHAMGLCDQKKKKKNAQKSPFASVLRRSKRRT